MNIRKIKQYFIITVLVVIIIVFIGIYNIFKGNFSVLSKETGRIAIDNHKKELSTNATFTTSPGPPIMKSSVNYYELVNDKKYHYEFRFEYNTSNANDDPRLMILLNGNVRTCSDYWQFSVGRRILNTLHSSGFLILVICSKKKTYDPEGPIQKNADVKWIHASLQKWMNEVYYNEFQRYPRLYIHGISRGSKIGALLCRILPIQGQIFTVFPGRWYGLLPDSDYSTDLQKRLQLDTVFANWFYFDFCCNKTNNKTKISDLCPFQNERKNYQPVPPTYILQSENDGYSNVSEYISLIDRVRQNALRIGGVLLNYTDAIKFYILSPANITPTYMQEMFDTWHSKPNASKIFYEHFVNRSRYKLSKLTQQTCWCLPIDFTYFESYPNITKKWPKKQLDEYKDYANDIKQFKQSFCEEVCGDLVADHAMLSRDLDKAVGWINTMDSLRQSLSIEDYTRRPLRIWMYERNSIMTKTDYFYLNKPDYVNISMQYHMYASEYFIQEYCLRLKASGTFARHNIQWADNPLLADYYVIPNDLSYYYFYPDVNRLHPHDFRILVERLNTDYFHTLLTNIRTMYPYWNMAKQADQMGSNHILAIVTGRNMGIFHDSTKELLKNVIQVVFTGLRQDLLPPGTPPARDYRGTLIIYRHGYDMVIPQYTRTRSNISIFENMTVLAKKKRRLFFFAGALEHTMTAVSARPRIREVWSNINDRGISSKTIEIQGKHFDTMTVIQGHQKPHEYIESIQSSVFLFCPEGFFPWSPRLYDAILIGAIPFVLVDNIVLPFERFIDWTTFSAKINVSNINDIVSYVHKIDNFENYIIQKLKNVQPHLDAFKWPYAAIGENGHKEHVFLPDEDRNGSIKNALYYVSLEFRCRRLEQLYGLTVDSFSKKSIEAQRQACTAHPTICPCHDRKRSVAFREYL